MLCYYLKFRKHAENKNPKDVRTKNGKMMLYQDVQCATVKNPNSLKSKKLVEY